MAQDKIAEAMGIAPLTDETKNLPVEEEKKPNLPALVNEALTDEKVVIDYNYVRENLYGAIEKGQDALSEMLEIAKQSQSARAFEVVAMLINTIASVSKDVLDNQKNVRDIIETEGSQTPRVGTVNANNVVFAGSTADLAAQYGHDARTLLKEKNEEKVINAETVE